jgi:hypothetical protein
MGPWRVGTGADRRDADGNLCVGGSMMRQACVLLATVALIAACGAERATGTSVTSRSFGQDPTRTLVAADGPIFFVDGKRLPVGARLDLAPADIASIEVLKGTAARELYGPDGSRGVIRIFLKGSTR